ncbi:MAG TPA: TlpA disulfide reductase family protein [Pyrinomonadaceae bacterium]|nr:TlpA disulfide reductase family protein [Pyrinomonadaceae bacterium]
MDRRIRFGLALLCVFILAAHPVTPGSDSQAKAARLNREAAGLRASQTAPGVGANTEDPRRVLAEAGRAVGGLRSVTYEAAYQGVGAFATRTSLSVGRVKIAKLGAGNPLTARLAAEGDYYPAGKADPEPFRVSFDGKTVLRLRAGEKALMRKALDENDPKERDFGFVTSLLGAGANQLILFEFTLAEPFKRQDAGDVLEYEGRTAVGGVLCHVVYAEYDRRPDGRVRRERWFLGVKDGLPRKFELVSADDKGRFGAFVLTLSNLRADSPLGGTAFAVPLPRGYRVTAYVPPSRPQLLALGERAPDFKLADPSGKIHALSDYRGKLVVLDFWATWCGPCVRAMPALQALHAKYQGRGVEVLGVNSWEESNPAAYFKEKGYTYKLLLRGEAVAPAYRVGTLPTLYVIGFDGEVIYRGVMPGDNAAAVIEQYLRERGK